MKTLLLFLTGLVTLPCFAQWNYFHQVNNDYFYVLTENNNQLFLGAEQANIYAQTTGNNFDIIELQKSGFLYDIAFANNEVGYAGSGCYYTTDDCPETTLYKTLDGGKTWELIHQFGITGVIVSVEIIDENRLYVLPEYGEVQYSNDGGETWTTILVDENINRFEQLQFIDKNIGFVIGSVYTQGVGYHNVLLKTTDAGQTWTEIYYAADENNKFESYFMVNHQTGFVTAKNGEIHQTIDGGTTWNPIQLSSNPYVFCSKIFFISNQVGYVSGVDEDANISYLYRTNDGGNTWAIDLELASELITDFYFSDSENGYLIANYNKIYQRNGIIESSTIQYDLEISPNPTIDYFTINIELPLNKNFQMTVFDATGRRVFSTSQVYQKVYTSEWKSGIYFIEVRNNDNEIISRGKLVKRR